MKRLVLSILFFVFACVTALAGPPFTTDDPEPVEYRNWECYFASQYERNNEGTTGTAPHFDINYGIAREAHLNVVIPLAYAGLPGNSMNYGPGDMEIGVKYRFVSETPSFPQIAIYPRIVSPTGNSSLGLGEGKTAYFLPVWLQKSFGPWTVFGGGGPWHNDTGPNNNNYWQTGCVLQRDISKTLTLGLEAFNFSAGGDGEDARTGADAGATYNFNDNSHVLCSAGGDVTGSNALFFYIAYQLTVGPR